LNLSKKPSIISVGSKENIFNIQNEEVLEMLGSIEEQKRLGDILAKELTHK
jgi:hypothetical protein